MLLDLQQKPRKTDGTTVKMTQRENGQRHGNQKTSYAWLHGMSPHGTEKITKSYWS